MKTIKAKISLLVLLLGLFLILANERQTERSLTARNLSRIEREASATGARLAGMMQLFFRKGQSSAAELEMSYTSVSSDLEQGLVCDREEVVRFATRLEWRGMKLNDAALGLVSQMAGKSRQSGAELIQWDTAHDLLTVVFPFSASYDPQDIGVIALVYGSSHALASARDEALHESLVQGCVLGAVCLVFCLALDLLLRKRVEMALEYSHSVIVGEAPPPALRGADELSEIVQGFAEAVEKVHHTESLLLEATESERLRMGRDIHDDICQRLAAAQLKIGMLHHDLMEEGSPHAAFAAEVTAELTSAAAATRMFANGLVPVLMEKDGLVDALRRLADQLSSSFGSRCEMNFEMDEFPLAAWVQDHLFRIAQELVVNAFKHAKSTCVFVRLSVTKQLLRLEVENDGMPFVQGKMGDEGLGTRFLRLRISALGGRLSYSPRSTKESGTLALCEVQLTDRHRSET